MKETIETVLDRDFNATQPMELMRRYYMEVLERNNYRTVVTAKELGLNRRTVYSFKKRHGLPMCKPRGKVQDRDVGFALTSPEKKASEE